MDLFLKIIIQTIIAFFAILFLTRILGKQQIAQLTFYEYINGITFGSIAATMATDTSQKIWEHLTGLVVFAILTGLMSYISMKNRIAKKIINGEPVIVIQDGKILEGNLRKMRLELDELMAELRSKDIFSAGDVKIGIIEPSGEISALLKEEFMPLTKKDIGIKGDSKGINIELIIDGQLIYNNLQDIGLTAKWLIQELKKQKVNGIKEVAYASINDKQELYIDLYHDNIKDMIDASDEEIPFSMNTIGKKK
ncbi:Uncharacterized membrane protein YcaP, DUF421 family [Desulfonispora thiosulfatigenes DSM 11270]|uniref:Uncharacterized membrane protein YcaP, DUF421 family n=1 Tax=Desulfonispora thiosulfatigenes DSM 11270 TaxID=656914 RepID=A0A1W1VCD7_DESTI|nr:DUF421 domain-containing protein [Desulfonispora thiosulfatigenes]SMB90966.1 Uncharacterized membrane protein YcaP, DUF421 family [Desulfonispora thiosulfatigenes DSM 11270]